MTSLQIAQWQVDFFFFQIPMMSWLEEVMQNGTTEGNQGLRTPQRCCACVRDGGKDVGKCGFHPRSRRVVKNSKRNKELRD